MINDGEIVLFMKQKDYIMVNNNLGAGSFGKTVVLKDPFIDELFVAKKYEPEYQEDKEKFYKNFLDEIKILHKLNHRNIVRIFNYYAYEKEFTGFILMEYIEGKDIGSFIEDYAGPFENVTLDEIFIQLIDAFCYIEALGIIHRDIREGNILIDMHGVVKVIDFGIGKVLEKPEADTDSLVSQINRANSDTLPQEYYCGTYTSQTDMFYLAELLNRLMANADMMGEFSNHRILEKMMQKNPANRYATFDEVRKEIGKRGFIAINTSTEDKRIYQMFTNGIFNALECFIDERKFISDPASFILKLEKVLLDNLFEDTILSNSELIQAVVKSGFKYLRSIVIPCKAVSDFLVWYKDDTQENQALILNNFVSKLSTIRVDMTDSELPF